MNGGKEGFLMWSKVFPRVILFALAAGVAFGGVIVTPTVTSDGSLYTYDYQLENTELSAAIVNFQLTISGSTTGILAPNEEWLTETFPVGSETGIQWITMEFGIQLGEALSGFLRVISSDAAGPATFHVDFDDFKTSIPGSTQGPSGVPEPAGATLVGTGLAQPAGGSLPFASSWGSMRGWAALSKS